MIKITVNTEHGKVIHDGPSVDSFSWDDGYLKIIDNEGDTIAVHAQNSWSVVVREDIPEEATA